MRRMCRSLVVDDQREAREAVVDMKQKIELELQQDEEKLKYLRERMQRGQGLTDQMHGILASFDDRLGALETSLLPLHKETVKLSTMQKNVHDLELMLKDIIVYYSTNSKQSSLIDEGPRGHLADYLKSIEEVDKAIAYFEKNNTDSPEYKRLVTLKNRALGALEDEFHKLLQEESAPYTREELELLDDSGTLGERTDISTLLTHDAISTLRTILRYMHSEQVTGGLISTYANVRGKVIRNALESVAAPFVESAEPVKKESRRSMIGRMSMKGSKPSRRLSLKGPGGGSDPSKPSSATRGHRRNMSNDLSLDMQNGNSGFVIIYEKGSHSFVVYSWTIMRAMVRENALLKQLSADDGSDVGLFNDLTNALLLPPIETWIAQGELLYSSASQRSTVGTPGLFIYDAVLFFYLKAAALLKVLQEPNYQMLLRLHQVANNFADLGRRSLLRFPHSIQGDDLTKVPLDGTVHELTSTTLRFVTSLYDYRQVIGGLLHEEFKIEKELSLQPEELSTKAMGIWLNDVLTDLVDNITRKGRTFEDPALTAVFLMNNFDYISGYLLTSPYSALIQQFSERIVDEFKQKVVEQQKAYRDCTWGSVAASLRVEQHHQQGTVSLAKKEREQIKEQYSRFNDLVDDTLSSQKDYAVPSASLRAQLRESNVQLLLPAYTKFDNCYRNTDFSRKNPEKYLKYTPEDLRLKLTTELFGDS